MIMVGGDNDPKDSNGPYYDRIDGILSIFGFSLIVWAVFLIIETLRTINAWITNSTTIGSDLFLFYILLITLGQTLVIIALIYFLVKRKKFFLRLFIFSMSALLGLTLLPIAAASGMRINPYIVNEISSASAQQFVRILVYAVVWSLYLLLSKRAKKTFTQ